VLSRRGRPPLWLGLAIVMGLAALAGAGREAARWLRSERITGAAEVIDGDSLRVGGRELRLEGIDAPEYRQTCRRGDSEEPCGRQAREALARLVASGPLHCDIDATDRYGRGLATCRAGAVEINRMLVRDGMAVAFGRYEDEEAAAQAARRGIWATRFQRPADWRTSHPRSDP